MDTIYEPTEADHREYAMYSVAQLLPQLDDSQLEMLAESIHEELNTRRQDADTSSDPVKCQECGAPLDCPFDNCCETCRKWLRENLNSATRTDHPALTPTRLMEVAT